MSRFRRAAPDMTNGMTTPLLPQTEVAIGRLAIQETGMSHPHLVIWEAALAIYPQVTLHLLCHPLPLEELFILTVPMMVRGTDMAWSITMRSIELVRMACHPTKPNVLVFLLLPLPPQPLSETVLWPNRSTHMSVGPYPLLRPRTTPEIAALSGECLVRQCPPPVMDTPTSAPDSLRFPGSQVTESHVPGTHTQKGCLRHRLHATLIERGPVKVRIGLR